MECLNHYEATTIMVCVTGKMRIDEEHNIINYFIFTEVLFIFY